MEEVGNKMARGEMILPFVLQAAEVMKDALAVLEPHLAGQNSALRGKIILATVYGDVHDIGKNLVGSILKNQGYNVIDLGKQVAVETIIAAIKKEQPDAVGLSALLVTTSREMQRCVDACSSEGITVPIIIGGAAVNKAYAQRIAVPESGMPYAGGVYYAKDAFDAIRVLDAAKKIDIQESAAPAGSVVVDAGSTVSDAVPEPVTYGEPLVPPFYGTSAVLRWDAQTVLGAVSQERLFKAFWGGGRLSSEEYTKTVEQEFIPAFKKLSEIILDEHLLDARALYAFFPVYTHDDKVFLLDSGNFSTELASFTFPRVARKKNRSIADYLRPEGDVIGVQVVTIGKGLSERAAVYLQKEQHYSLGYYINALGNYLTEQIVERVSVEMRRALMVPPNSGHRYSFGFAGLPGVEAQETLFTLLSVEERLDIVLTPGFQMNPEHSTMGIFIHHPEAEYM
jgi:5-methyltetrahydrofolate--homocysteine methyltransferase